MESPAQVRMEDRALGMVYCTLKIVFGLVPIVAGLDKFTNILVHWERYLAPALANLIPMRPSAFMHVVGIIEIVAGIGVLLTPWRRPAETSTAGRGSPGRRLDGMEEARPGQAGGLSSSSCFRNGITPGMTHLSHISSILLWQ